MCFDGKKPKIAILMSVYKNDKLEHLIESVESLLNQTYGNFVIYICVDGIVPTDNKNYLEKLDKSKVILFQRDDNRGLAYSLNELIQLALNDKEIEYLARMDADDIAIDKRLQLQVDFMQSNPEIDVSGGFCREFGGVIARGVRKVYSNHEDIVKNMFKKCPFIHPTVIFRRRVFDSGARYPTDKPKTEDLALWYSLAFLGMKFANIEEEIILFRIDDETLLRRRGLSKAFTELKIRLYYLIKLKRFIVSDIAYVLLHYIVRILPAKLFNVIYRNN
ncbi:glycosyltransferase [Pectobacterium cacticida]|uniref:Glycosyltransferase n=1 Tax=Pectobacterium cacticida TaxID=69221 RepID=A0ABZ2G773_9GAMM|nr:glycosyltransferase [Pectobacterium cacticida]UYX08004.1 glycosyltransferase [Pectobacterium cacticida]